MSERAVFFPAGGWNNGSARTRLYYYLEHLRDRAVHYHIASYTHHRYDNPDVADGAPLLRKLWLELLPLRNVVAVLGADALWFQKHKLPRWAVHLARGLGKRVLYDLDDAIYLPKPIEVLHEPFDRSVDTTRDRANMEWMLERADHVVVSGEALGEFARRLNPSVEIIPTVVDRVAPAPSQPRHPPVLGWVGAPENQRYLMRLENMLLGLQAEWPGLEVWIVTSRLCSPPPRFRYRFIPWSREAEAEAVPQFTVGLAPLDDDEWCRAKMNYKAIVYMSHGVPAVVSPVGFPVGDFHHDETVWYARDENDWRHALKDVLSDRSQRDAVARAALDVLARKYTAAAQADRWTAALLGRPVPRNETMTDAS